MITIRNYKPRKNARTYGAHTMRVDLPHITVWFSYETPIAFASPDGYLYVRLNEWGPTTRQHMCAIVQGWGDRVTTGIEKQEFEDLLEMRLLETPTMTTVPPGDFCGRILTKLRFARSLCKQANDAFQWEASKALAETASGELTTIIDRLNKIRYKLRHPRVKKPKEPEKLRRIIL